MSFLPNTILDDPLMPAAVIALGANLDSEFGSPRETLALVLEDLQTLSQKQPVASSLLQSAPQDCPPVSPEFTNGVVVIWPVAKLDPRTLLLELHALEAKYGRRRSDVANQARSLDLDLICFGDAQCNDSDLILPHPRAHQREFVLQPLAEIAPELMLPGHTVTVRALLDQLRSNSACR